MNVRDLDSTITKFAEQVYQTYGNHSYSSGYFASLLCRVCPEESIPQVIAQLENEIPYLKELKEKRNA